MLQAEFDAEVTLLYVADEGDADAGREFLERWADTQDLADAQFRIETGDVEAGIQRAGRDATMLIIGATERGLLSRLVRGSLVLDVLYDVDCSVLLAEKKHDRGRLERLFGGRTRGPHDRDHVVEPAPTAPGVETAAATPADQLDAEEEPSDRAREAE